MSEQEVVRAEALSRYPTLLRWGLGLLIVGGLAVLLLFGREPVLAAVERLDEVPTPVAGAVLAAAYVPNCLMFLPGWPLTVGAGALLGVGPGVIAVSLGATAGASASFLAGRFLARGWVERRLQGSPRFAALDEAVAREGWKIVLLTRLSPVFPFNLLNYAFGLTRIRFWEYAWTTWVGMLPGSLMYVYIGSTFRDVAAALSGIEGGRERTTAEQVLFYGGLVVTVGLTVYITHLARRALRRAGVAADSGETA